MLASTATMACGRGIPLWPTVRGFVGSTQALCMNMYLETFLRLEHFHFKYYIYGCEKKPSQTNQTHSNGDNIGVPYVYQ